jgi:hypothetical protein
METKYADINNSSESIVNDGNSKIEKLKETNDNIRNNLLSYSNSFTDYSSIDCDSLTDSSNKWQQNSSLRNRVFNNYSYEKYERNDETDKNIINLSTVNEDLNSIKEDLDKERDYHYQNINRPKAALRPITRRGRENSRNSDYAELIDFSDKTINTKEQEKLEKYNSREELIFNLNNNNNNNSPNQVLNNSKSKYTKNLPVINKDQIILDDNCITIKPPLSQTFTKSQQKQSLLKNNIKIQLFNQKNIRLNSRLEERNINSRNTMRTNTSTSTCTRSSSMLHSRKMNPDEIQESVKRLYYIPNRNAQHPKFQTIHSRSLSKQEIDALSSRLYLNSTPKYNQQTTKPTVKVLDKIAIDKLVSLKYIFKRMHRD